MCCFRKFQQTASELQNIYIGIYKLKLNRTFFFSTCVLFLQGHDEEAVVDMGKISSTINTNFEKEELESKFVVVFCFLNMHFFAVGLKIYFPSSATSIAKRN